MLSISKNSLALIAGGFKLSLCFITPILMIQVEKVVSVGYSSCTFGCKPRLTVWLQLVSLGRNIAFHSIDNPIRDLRGNFRRTMFEDVRDRNLRNERSKAIPFCFRIPKNFPMKRSIRSYIALGLNLNLYQAVVRGA